VLALVEDPSLVVAVDDAVFGEFGELATAPAVMVTTISLTSARILLKLVVFTEEVLEEPTLPFIVTLHEPPSELVISHPRSMVLGTD
jgi:hypothetical protein